MKRTYKFSLFVAKASGVLFLIHWFCFEHMLIDCVLATLIFLSCITCLLTIPNPNENQSNSSDSVSGSGVDPNGKGGQ